MWLPCFRSKPFTPSFTRRSMINYLKYGRVGWDVCSVVVYLLSLPWVLRIDPFFLTPSVTYEYRTEKRSTDSSGKIIKQGKGMVQESSPLYKKPLHN